MKIGISTSCYYGDKEVEDVVSLYGNNGISHAEVFLNCMSEYKPEFIAEIKKRKGALKVHSIHAHGTSFEPELFCPHQRSREDAEEVFRSVCRAGFELNAKYITFHGPFVKKDRELDLDYGWFSARVNQLCEIAASYGMFIAYENVNWAFGSKPEFFTELLSYCPDLKATLDIKQSLFSNIDPLRFAEAMGDRLVTIHVCDMDKSLKQPMLPFKGRYNFERFFREIKHRTDIDPAVFVEVYRNNFNEFDELKDCYEKISSLIESIK